VASVTILDQTYVLPAIATERFQALQERVQAQQQVIQTGLRTQPRLLGMIPRPPRMLTPEERWHELDLLVRNYDAIIAELGASKEAYAAFFGQLAAGVQQALIRQSAAMQHLEEERLADAQHPEVAVHFEAYMRDHLGPLQGILEQVVRVDSDLHRAVAEIEDLTRQLMLQQHLAPLPGSELLDERWLTLLTVGQLKKERLEEMWKRLEQQDGDLEALEIDIATSMASAASPVLTALDNIRTLVEVRLAPLAPAPVTVAPEMGNGASRTRVVSVSPPEPRLVDRFGISFVLIQAGTFQMGSDHGNNDEKPVHTVRLSRPFYLGIYPVTQRQWEAVTGSNPSRFQGPEHPVEQVSWDKAQEFIRSLNTHEGRTLYRLPTEAEWEYAARAGTTGDYCFGDDVTELALYAWYEDNARGTTHPVGQLRPNAWELYDMHGNVWEWVQDWYGSQEYARRAARGTAVVDPAGPAAGSDRVDRGGSWLHAVP